jgi:Tfp pilus assembly protein FimT
MVVLAMIALLLTMALPDFLGYMNRGRVETAAQDLEARYRLARQRAITERSIYRLALNPGSGTYRIERQTGPSTWVGAPDETFSLPTGVNMTANLGGDGSNVDLVIDQRGVIDFDDVPALIRVQGANDTLGIRIVRTGRIRTDRDL